MPSRPKRPRDPNQLAKLILDIATGERGQTNGKPKRAVKAKQKAKAKRKAQARRRAK